MILSFEQEENIWQGLVFRGHDESYDSSNQENFLELLQFLANHNKDYNVVAFKNALDNLKLTSPEIQKDIVSVASNETNGLVIEHFLGVEHVTSTTTLSLKATLDNFFSRHGLSFSRLLGQGYDGASNMQGEFNGLKTLVLKDNRCAYYIHCFAHQLQLDLAALAKNHDNVNDLFNIVAIVVNIVGASSKRCDLLRDKQACKVLKLFLMVNFQVENVSIKRLIYNVPVIRVGACIMVR
ncbi:zinc finger MYM-type protein 1-like [Pistacia vera]|uniref:zinc finger MYM-type protein 1-like n=1 Tax=Pistacia vera TaxID=55513 RepID=UPI001262D630|nr:zinc finger MYM-type protein 1-like [Pistacia vera]